MNRLGLLTLSDQLGRGAPPFLAPSPAKGSLRGAP